jgi:hypothetical protein
MSSKIVRSSVQDSNKRRLLTERALLTFLNARKGKQWADVLPELKSTFALPENLEHGMLKFGLAIRTTARQGKQHVADPLRGAVPVEGYSVYYYVDSVTKALVENDAYARTLAARNAQKAREADRAKASRRELSEMVQAHQVTANTWVLVGLAHFKGRAFDVLLGRYVEERDDKAMLSLKYGKPDVHAIERRELKYPEMRQLGLLREHAR